MLLIQVSAKHTIYTFNHISRLCDLRRSHDVKHTHTHTKKNHHALPLCHINTTLILSSMWVWVCVCIHAPQTSYEPVIDLRPLVACAEDHANKITTLQTRRGDLARWADQQQQHLEPNANYTCHSKFGPLQYFTAGVTQYFHTMRRNAEWVGVANIQKYKIDFSDEIFSVSKPHHRTTQKKHPVLSPL